MLRGLNFGFIGLGQAGCNIANEFAKLGYRAIAVNTSQTDLALIDNIHKNNKLLINVGTQGAGKNPAIGRKSLEEKIEDVYNLIENVFTDKVDKLFVCAGMGGGTGSGMITLMCEILTEQGFNVGVITTSPGDTESPRVKLICLSTYEEITAIEDLTNIFIIDNKKAFDRLPGVGLNKKYQIVNSAMAKQLDNINKMSTKPSLIAFDAKDLETVLQSRGLSVVNQVTIDNIDDLKNENTLSLLLKEAVESSLSSNIDNYQVNAAVFLFELPKGKGTLINEEAMGIMQRQLGNPFDIFYGIYEDESDNKGKMGSLTILLTGIDTTSISRMEEIQEDMLEKQEEYAKKLDKQGNSFKGKSSELLDKFTMNKPKTPKKEGESTLSKLRKRK